jgi:hypothetical protein
VSADAGYSLLLEFDTPGSDFVRGVEIGRLWEQLKVDGPVEQTVHACNAEMVLRLAEATGRAVTADPLDDEWLHARFDAPGEVADQERPACDPYCDGC